MMAYTNSAAALVIAAWAVWCVLSPRVRSGVVGTVIYAAAALAAVAVLIGPGYGYDRPPTAEVTLNWCLALHGARHFVVKVFWPRRHMRRRAGEGA